MYKQIKVPQELHKELKIAAAKDQTTLVKLLWKFLNKLKNAKNEKR